MTEPRTEAGRDLLGLVDLRAAAVSVSVEFLQHQILAIEREAADVDAWAACSKCAWRVGGVATMMEAATWLREHQQASHAAPAPGIRPCLCVVHEDALAVLRDEGPRITSVNSDGTVNVQGDRT